MTEQDDTQQAPEGCPTVGQGSNDGTAASASGADAETTFVPADPATVDAYAWSEGDEPADAERHPWARVLAIAAGVLALGAVAAVVVATNGHHDDSDLHQQALPVTVRPSAVSAPPSAPEVTTVTVTATPAPPPSKTVDVAPPTTAAAAVPTTTTWAASQPGVANPQGNPYPLVLDAAGDQKLLSAVRAKSSVRNIVDSNPALVINEAHRWCRLLYQGATLDQADNAVQAETGWDDIDTTLLMGSASDVYRGCY